MFAPRLNTSTRATANRSALAPAQQSSQFRRTLETLPDARRASHQFSLRDFSQIPRFPAEQLNDRAVPPGSIGQRHRKLAIGRADNALEQEADRVADQVVGGVLQGVPANNAPVQVARASSGVDDAAQREQGADAPAIVHEVLRAGGQSLDAATRAYFEPRFGHDLGHVRLHTDARATESAKQVNALAYTVGSDVVVQSGKYAPDEDNGKRLLAHELAHVLQQPPAKLFPLLMRTPDAGGKPPIPKPGHTPFNFISESPALGNWKEAVKGVLEREFKTKFSSFEEANAHFQKHLRDLPSDAAREDFADRMRDRARKAFYRQEGRSPSYAYEPDDIQTLKGGAAPSGEMQLEHMEEVKTKVRDGKLIKGHPERALDPANIYITEGGPGGTAPKGTKHAEKQRTIEAAKKTSREIRDKASKVPEEGGQGAKPGPVEPEPRAAERPSKSTSSMPEAPHVEPTKKPGQTLSKFPPEGSGPISGQFNDGAAIRTLTTAVTTVVTAVSIGTQTDISALGWVEHHFASEIDNASKELDAKYPYVDALRNDAGIEALAKAYDASIAELNAPNYALIMAEVGVLTVPEKDREAYIQDVRQRFAKMGGGEGRWKNYLNAGDAYTEAAFKLQEVLGDSPWQLPKIAREIDVRAAALTQSGDELEQLFWRWMQTPAIAIPTVYYELFDLLHVAGVLKNLGARLNGLSSQISARANAYQRLWDQLEAGVNKVSKDTERLAFRFHMKPPKH